METKAAPSPAVDRTGSPSPENASGAGRADAAKVTAAPIVRVSLDRLDELQTIAHELGLARTNIAESLDKFAKLSTGVQPNTESLLELEALLARQLTLSNELQQKLDQIRMVRFGTLSTRLNRAVHVTCQEENKTAELTIENEDIELDTQIIDGLVEPLLHLLRNAVVHGIEPPETRRMIGKPEKARIAVGVERKDSNIVLSVSDDGRGVTVSKLKEKALRSGSISQQLADSMTDEEALELMFLRGVTTAEKLSLNAGRGIGMSIVREAVESRGGMIWIESEPQKGSVFMIRLPMVPVTAKSGPSTARPQPVPAAQPKFEEEIIENEEVAIADDEPAIAAPVRAELCVLIVDDSALMRQTISKVIERAGWQALTAIDGREAMEILSKAGNQPDIIITDLEMPGLDGLGLIEALKRNPRLFEIPVIMVTSRSERVHREKAFALGAAKFLTKPIEGGELKSIINSLCLVEA
jgi:CheY-like chemotaxis protein/two-component sensor histidine kinase